MKPPKSLTSDERPRASANVDAPQAAESISTAARFYSEQQAADHLQISSRSLQRQVKSGAGPPRIRLGRRVLYPVHELTAWALAHIDCNAP